MAVYGYARCSSIEQNEARQIYAFQELNIPTENIYTDKQSGKDFNRSAFQALLNKVIPGDLIYCLSIDRFGRNYDEILRNWRVLTKERGIDIVIIDMPLLDTRLNRDLMGTFIVDLVLQILSFVAHNERDTIRSRQAAGIAVAKARGVHMGRPAKKLPDNFMELARLWEYGKLRTTDLIAQVGLSETTLYRRLRKYRFMKKN